MDWWQLTEFETQTILLSLKVAGTATLGSLPLALGAAWVLARRRFPGKTLVEGAIHLPLILPPVVTGYLLLMLLGRQGWLGSLLHQVFGIQLVFNWTGAALAAGVVSFPLVVNAIRLVWEELDQGLEAVATTLGAGHLRVFLTIVLPQILPGIAVGALLGFARALGEFGATITFVSNIPGETRTIPLAIYTATQMLDGEFQALRLCVLSVLIGLGALVLANRLKPHP